MFNSLKGTVTFKGANAVFLEVGGVEWDLYVPASSADAVAVGSEARFFTWLYLRENEARLFGFATEDERRAFLDLISVDGVGAKGAIRILSNIALGQFVTALDEGRVEVLEAVSGIGKKTAAKIMLALKGKLTLDDAPARPVRAKQSEFQDVINSLAEMGYDKRDAGEAVQRIAARLMEDEAFALKAHTAKEEAIFRQALIELS